MPCLIDTNVLVFAGAEESPFHAVARARLAELQTASEVPCVTWQVLREYVSVVTRRSVLAVPRTPAEAVHDARVFARRFTVLPDPPDVLERWMELEA